MIRRLATTMNVLKRVLAEDLLVADMWYPALGNSLLHSATLFPNRVKLALELEHETINALKHKPFDHLAIDLRILCQKE